jgi:hypothetical protein
LKNFFVIIFKYTPKIVIDRTSRSKGPLVSGRRGCSWSLFQPASAASNALELWPQMPTEPAEKYKRRAGIAHKGIMFYSDRESGQRCDENGCADRRAAEA